MGRTKWVTAALVLALAACGGSSSSSSKPETRTVKQVASVVSEYQQPILDAVAADNNCDYDIDCLSALAVLARRKNAAGRASNFAVALKGTYPPEIRVLAKRTQRQLVELIAADGALELCGQRTGSLNECRTELDAVDKVFLDQLPATLRAWEPYL